MTSSTADVGVAGSAHTTMLAQITASAALPTVEAATVSRALVAAWLLDVTGQHVGNGRASGVYSDTPPTLKTSMRSQHTAYERISQPGSSPYVGEPSKEADSEGVWHIHFSASRGRALSRPIRLAAEFACALTELVASLLTGGESPPLQHVSLDAIALLIEPGP